jgi:ribosome-binding ATPase YchF (GTP1/OBG family)
MSAEEEKMLVNYQFLTDKPLLVVLNIDDADAARAPEIEREFAPKLHGGHVAVAAISGKIEQELPNIRRRGGGVRKDSASRSPASTG